MGFKPGTYTTGELVNAGVLAIGDGYRAKNVELSATGLPFARAGNINGGFRFEGTDCFPESDLAKVGEKVSRPGDVVFTSKGSVGRFAFVREQTPHFVFSPQLCYWRSLDRRVIEPRFLYYWMQSGEFIAQANSVKGQTDMADYVSLTDQRRMRITLPSINEQLPIARILGALDDKIELNRRMNATLEAMARALFKSWFVDFDPVTAKAAGRKPFGMNTETAALFPARFTDSPLGPMPKGWRVGTVGEFISNYDSKRVPVSGAERAKRRGPYPYYGAASVMDYVDDYLFDGIYLLVGEDGSVVKDDGCAVTQYVWGKIWVNNHAHVLQGKPPVCTEHLWTYFQVQEVASIVTGAVQPKINQRNLNSLPFPYPGEALCRKFDDALAPWFARIRANSEETRTLASLRDALLPKLLSGEIRLKNAEKFVESVA